jgi:hypothetical protein
MFDQWPLGAHPEPMRADANLSPPGLAQLVIEVLDLLGLSGATLVGNDSGGVLLIDEYLSSRVRTDRPSA